MLDIKKILEDVPGSYDDFVNDTLNWMKKDKKIHDAILDQLRVKPESDTDDLTLVLWKHLGIGKPLVLVKDENPDGEFSKDIDHSGENEEKSRSRKGFHAAIF